MTDQPEQMDLRFIKIADPSELTIQMGAESPGSMILTMAPLAGVDQDEADPCLTIASDIDGVNDLHDIRSLLVDLVTIIDTATPGEPEQVTVDIDQKESD